MDLEEALAAIHAPHHTGSDVVTRVRAVQVYELVSSTPRMVDVEAALENPAVDYLLRVSTNCFHNEKIGASWYNDASAGYLLEDGALRAALDGRLGVRCHCEPSEIGEPEDLALLRTALAGFDANGSPCLAWGGWDNEEYK